MINVSLLTGSCDIDIQSVQVDFKIWHLILINMNMEVSVYKIDLKVVVSVF